MGGNFAENILDSLETLWPLEVCGTAGPAQAFMKIITKCKYRKKTHEFWSKHISFLTSKTKFIQAWENCSTSGGPPAQIKSKLGGNHLLHRSKWVNQKYLATTIKRQKEQLIVFAVVSIFFSEMIKWKFDETNQAVLVWANSFYHEAPIRKCKTLQFRQKQPGDTKYKLLFQTKLSISLWIVFFLHIQYRHLKGITAKQSDFVNIKIGKLGF